MKLYTGYFARHARRSPLVFSIGGKPWWISLPRIRELEPSTELLSDYKSGRIGWNEYVPRYVAQLERLGIERIESLLQEGMILCCWEAPGKPCHRHLLAEWLRVRGHDVEELDARSPS